MASSVLRRGGPLLSAASFATLLFALATPSAGAQGTDSQNYFRGKPKGFKAGNPAAFYVWLEGDKWNVWSTTAGKPHRFQGRVTIIGGKIKDVFGENGENLKGKSDRYVWRNDKLEFDFKTKGNADGISFTVDEDAKEIEFQFTIDGKPQPGLVHLGRQNQRAGTNPFKLPAR